MSSALTRRCPEIPAPMHHFEDAGEWIVTGLTTVWWIDHQAVGIPRVQHHRFLLCHYIHPRLQHIQQQWFKVRLFSCMRGVRCCLNHYNATAHKRLIRPFSLSRSEKYETIWGCHDLLDNNKLYVTVSFSTGIYCAIWTLAFIRLSFVWIYKTIKHT